MWNDVIIPVIEVSLVFIGVVIETAVSFFVEVGGFA